MKHVSPKARAAALFDRINTSSRPARAAERASAKVFRLAEKKDSAALFWLSIALWEHKRALVAMVRAEPAACVHCGRRDHALKLFATRSAQQL